MRRLTARARGDPEPRRRPDRDACESSPARSARRRASRSRRRSARRARPRALPARRERGRTDARRDAAARRGAGGEDKLGFTPASRARRRRRHAVQLPAAAGRAQGRPCARRRQRGRAEAVATPLTALKLAELLLEAGLPPHALQTITGPGGELGEALCADERVRKISFTGSAAVGRRIAQVAGVKLSLELGANCPVAVLPDADTQEVAQATAAGGFVNAGQVCISVQRVLIDREAYGDFLDALRPRVESIVVGDPLEDDTQLALASKREAERVEGTIRRAVEAGATLVGGGRERGVVQPTVVADVPDDSELWQEELFDPAVAVRRSRASTRRSRSRTTRSTGSAQASSRAT